MLDEGIAREVVNRVQRLRKKAQLQPSDAVTVCYTIEPSDHDLARIIDQHRDYIESSTKNPMTMEEQNGEVIIVEDYDLKGAQMRLTVTKGFENCLSQMKPAVAVAMKDHDNPFVPFVNVVSGSACGVVLLENPKGCNCVTSTQQLAEQVQCLFGMSKAPSLYTDQACRTEVGRTAVDALNGQTLFVSPSTGATTKGSCCPFVNVKFGSKTGSLLLENPSGNLLDEHAPEVLQATFGQSVSSLAGSPLNQVNWKKMAGQNCKAQ
jgi:isoleucyl-tRNA synthetase